MKFEEFLKLVAPKIGPNGAFDISRDAQLKAFQEILIEKTGTTQKEIDAEVEKQLGIMAQNIVNLPPIPEETGMKNDSSTAKQN